MKAINKNIIIKPIDEEVKTSSGLLLTGTDANSYRYLKAEVIQSGTLVENIKSGDIIYYDKARAGEIVINSENYTVIQEVNVVVVV